MVSNTGHIFGKGDTHAKVYMHTMPSNEASLIQNVLSMIHMG